MVSFINISNSSKNLPFIFTVLLFSAMTINCAEKTKTTAGNAPSEGKNTVVVEPVKPENPKAFPDSAFKFKLKRPVHFSYLRSRKYVAHSFLQKKYGKEGEKIILALNRLDQDNLWRADTLIVPDTVANIMSYSPFPFTVDSLRQIPKIILISRKIQAFAAYQNGILIKWGPTSTGRKSKPTPAGLFSTNWKSKQTTSTIDSSWILPFYFNFDSREGVAMHQFAMPGYPASHACVRLLENDAQWIFRWAEQWIVSPEGSLMAHGTPVIVFDEYGFGKRRPWRNLLENPSALNISEGELINNVLLKYLPVIKRRAEKREALLSEKRTSQAGN